MVGLSAPRVLVTLNLLLLPAQAAPALLHPALPLWEAQQGQVSMAVMPQAPPPIGLPQLDQQVTCPALQQRVVAAVGAEARVWSITVADPNGRLLAEVNGWSPRIPASNQKLISTAYALDQLGPDYRLKSQLWRLADGTFRLTGEGDPDLALPQLQRFAKLALGSGGGSGQPGSLVRLQIAEEPPQSWWPAGWDPSDRTTAYGAPITRLAVTSNAIHDAVLNPPSRLQTLLTRSAAQQGGKVELSLVSARQPLPAEALLLHEEPSTAMHGVNVADGSGLDRANRVTSRLLAGLLLRMDHHPYGRDYLASMAVAGSRGTLRRLYKGTSLEGRFLGKTGTISGVRSISGVLQTAEGPRYVSAVSNGAGSPNTTIGAVLREVQNTALCP